MLVCDDEPDVVKALRVLLGHAGYSVASAATAAQALESVAGADLAIVDLELPDMSGIELCRRVRAWSSIPILILSGLDDEALKVQALQAGADDYVTKPFGGEELTARLAALARRGGGSEQARVVARDLAVDLAARTVEVGGRAVALTGTEYAILATLVRERGRLVTSGHLVEAVWGPHAEAEGALRTHMANLRAKVEPGARTGGERLIRTEPGVGYRFAG